MTIELVIAGTVDSVVEQLLAFRETTGDVRHAVVRLHGLEGRGPRPALDAAAGRAGHAQAQRGAGRRPTLGANRDSRMGDHPARTTEVRCYGCPDRGLRASGGSASSSTSTSIPRTSRSSRAVLAPGWRFVCHESEIAGRGQYVRFDLAGDSVIVDPRRGGSRARAPQRLPPPRLAARRRREGVCRARLVCPFHGWSYDLDGTVRTTPKMHEGFDRTGWDLKRVWVEVWNGCVFVSLAQEAPEPIADRLAGADFSGYDLDRAQDRLGAATTSSSRTGRSRGRAASSATTAGSTIPSSARSSRSTTTATS